MTAHEHTANHKAAAVQLDQPNPADDFCTVQLQGESKDCYQALLQILQHAATAHSSDQWKDARRDAAVWQIQDQVLLQPSCMHATLEMATGCACKLLYCKQPYCFFCSLPHVSQSGIIGSF